MVPSSLARAAQSTSESGGSGATWPLTTTNLWSSYHTGLDFDGQNGDPIYSVANGVVTESGYAGAYGNRTIVTLDDGTEIALVMPGTTVTGIPSAASASRSSYPRPNT